MQHVPDGYAEYTITLTGKMPIDLAALDLSEGYDLEAAARELAEIIDEDIDVFFNVAQNLSWKATYGDVVPSST